MLREGGLGEWVGGVGWGVVLPLPHPLFIIGRGMCSPGALVDPTDDLSVSNRKTSQCHSVQSNSDIASAEVSFT